MQEIGSNMHRKQKASFVKVVVLCASLLTQAIFASTPSEDVPKYRVDGLMLYVHSNSFDRACPLDDEAVYAITSHDKSALIISARGYIPMADVMQCDADKKLHVKHIPEKVGALSDINLSKKIYVALDFVTIRPFGYVAVVSNIGSSRNLVTISGAASADNNIDKDQWYSFGVSGDMAGAAIISLDGRYVAPNGVIDCSRYASPGVWDIEKNSKVQTYNGDCPELFKPSTGMPK